MKKQTPEQHLRDAAKMIRQEIGHWHYINRNGCQDPFWPDGCNMNLTRNHIISYKLEMQQICEESGIVLPEEYYLPTPPEVDDDYMANRQQKERVERLIQQGHHLTRKKVKYDEGQLSIF